MRKNIVKSESGVTLVTLMFIIIIMAILVGAVVTNIDVGADIRNYQYMRADIELLEDKVMVYYNKNSSLPTKGEPFEITKTDLKEQTSKRDNSNYYQIDISLLNNITLNYGGGKDDEDIYIINEQSHEIYYLKGVLYEENMYYTIP